MHTLTTQEMQQKTRQGDPLVINVLDQSEFEKHHIPGSKNIPLKSGDFSQRVEEAAGSKDRSIVVYCASKQCDASDKAAEQLERNGFTNIYDFEGGMKDWEDAGLPVEGRDA